MCILNNTCTHRSSSNVHNRTLLLNFGQSHFAKIHTGKSGILLNCGGNVNATSGTELVTYETHHMLETRIYQNKSPIACSGAFVCPSEHCRNLG